MEIHKLGHDRIVVNIFVMPKCNFSNVASSNNYAVGNGNRLGQGSRPNMNPSFGSAQSSQIIQSQSSPPSL